MDRPGEDGAEVYEVVNMSIIQSSKPQLSIGNCNAVVWRQ